ncbi:hypothetical protein, partial [Rubripirellula obstinata]|uniref:hypothetical protein n=1 Tax=Rubripirellula obstinata TaxID=406547 RepID=UPI001EE4CCE8
ATRQTESLGDFRYQFSRHNQWRSETRQEFRQLDKPKVLATFATNSPATISGVAKLAKSFGNSTNRKSWRLSLTILPPLTVPTVLNPVAD